MLQTKAVLPNVYQRVI